MMASSGFVPLVASGPRWRAGTRWRGPSLSDVPHQLLDGRDLIGQPRQFCAKLVLIGHSLLGQLAVLRHGHRVRAMRLQAEVRPNDHGDRGADKGRDAEADPDARLGAARQGYQVRAVHSSLAVSFVSVSCSLARTASVIARA